MRGAVTRCSTSCGPPTWAPPVEENWDSDEEEEERAVAAAGVVREEMEEEEPGG